MLTCPVLPEDCVLAACKGFGLGTLTSRRYTGSQKERAISVSETDSFIQEVSEEVRRERFSKLLRRYGWIGALVVLGAVGGAGLLEWQKARQRAAAEEAGTALRQAYLVEDPAERAAELEAALVSLPEAEAVVRIAQAGSLLEAGDAQAAGAALAAVSEDAEQAPIYRDLALLQRVALLGPDMDRAERMAALETLLRPDGPFRLLALEQRALVRLEAGELDEARADLEAILSDSGITEGLAGRARQILIAAGGELPEAGPAATIFEEAVVPADASRAAADG